MGTAMASPPIIPEIIQQMIAMYAISIRSNLIAITENEISDAINPAIKLPNRFIDV